MEALDAAFGSPGPSSGVPCSSDGEPARVLAATAGAKTAPARSKPPASADNLKHSGGSAAVALVAMSTTKKAKRPRRDQAPEVGVASGSSDEENREANQEPGASLGGRNLPPAKRALPSPVARAATALETLAAAGEAAARPREPAHATPLAAASLVAPHVVRPFARRPVAAPAADAGDPAAGSAGHRRSAAAAGGAVSPASGGGVAKSAPVAAAAVAAAAATAAAGRGRAKAASAVSVWDSADFAGACLWAAGGGALFTDARTGGGRIAW